MTSPPENEEAGLPLFDPGIQTAYTLEIVAEITGIPSQTILSYQEYGLILEGDFDDDTVHRLRRIEHLRRSFEANIHALKLILELMEEVDRLKLVIRSRR